MNKLPGLFLILLWVSSSDCMKTKLPSVFDPVWQEESLGLNSKFCAKLRSCSEGEWEKLPTKVQTYAVSRLSDIECNTAHRKSNVFHLRGGNPDEIKAFTRACHNSIETLNCGDIQSGKIQGIPDCQKLESLQRLR